jgi:hypothetical protein
MRPKVYECYDWNGGIAGRRIPPWTCGKIPGLNVVRCRAAAGGNGNDTRS